ncbi:MAG: hypothetical protein JW925_05525 [Syntrophaceae bacterium]|nr:hypothetical protein [Syntrophaceae bacterium]
MREIFPGTLIVLFLATACATTPVVLPEKYNLDNYLEAVSSISVDTIRDFENVDNQAVILKADRNKYFLLVLRKPIDVEHSNLYIDIENSVARDTVRSTQTIVGAQKNTTGGAADTEWVQTPSKIIRIVAGIDRFYVVRNSSDEKLYYVVEKMYRLKGLEQANEIKERLRRS